jgi:hypothetical protein
MSDVWLDVPLGWRPLGAGALIVQPEPRALAIFTPRLGASPAFWSH